ncbi:hypothetical protein G6F40_013261 [Rhizopus arrhizus]|nr:hypothetical protein G6F40_013261 [Rhizopus arrhizus]
MRANRIIRRGPRDALRVKHADAPARRDFAGLEYWPGGPDWQVQARFIAHPPGKTLPIVDITGLTTEMPNAGAVEFQRDGRNWRLEAIGAPGQPLFLIFADRTSGRGSYPAGRYLDTDAPAADGTVRIDFNHAYNPPDLFRAATLLLACAVAPLVAARNAPAVDPAAAAAAKPPVPLLWKVTGPGDSRLYLLGSFHLLKPQDYPLSPDVEQAFEASQRIVFELSPEDMQSPQLASRMVQAAVRTDGSELKRDLDAATWQKLQAPGSSA